MSERLETERLERERLKTEKLKAERLKTERLEAERLETGLSERLETPALFQEVFRAKKFFVRERHATLCLTRETERLDNVRDTHTHTHTHTVREI